MADADPDKEEIGKYVHAVLPRLPIFSGDARDTNFDLWDFEVKCLQSEGRAEADIKLAIRRSLKGQASRTLMSLGTDANVHNILKKFRAVFGPTESVSTVLSKFYSMRQSEGEDAGAFASRLEDCLFQATSLGRVEKASAPIMLREAFEAGLRPQTRLAVGFLFNQPDLTFEDLVRQVKRMEQELNLLNAPAVRSIQQDKQIDELTAQVAELKTELRALKQVRTLPSPVPLAAPRPSFSHAPAPGTSARHRNAQHVFRQPAAGAVHQQRGAAAYQRPPRGQSGPITCWKCGQVGHVSRGCRQQPQPQPQPQAHLNFSRSVAAANPQARQYPPWWEGQQF